MKTEEDEAFEDIERRQGGFHAKRQAAMDKINAEFDEEYIKYRTAFPKGYTAPQQEPRANSFEEYCKTLPPLWNTHISRTYAEQFFKAGQAAQPAQEPVAQEKIHALKPMLEALRIKQIVSFSESQNLLAEVANKSGMLPPAFEISGNQWCALVNLAVARFGNTTPPKRPWVGLTDDEVYKIAFSLQGEHWRKVADAIEAKLKEKNT